jgi:hypothetical protein
VDSLPAAKNGSSIHEALEWFAQSYPRRRAADIIHFDEKVFCHGELPVSLRENGTKHNDEKPIKAMA